MGKDGVQFGLLGDQLILQFADHAQLQATLCGGAEYPMTVPIFRQGQGGVAQGALGLFHVLLGVKDGPMPGRRVELIDDILAFGEEKVIDLLRILRGIGVDLEFTDAIAGVQHIPHHGLIVAPQAHIGGIGVEYAAEAVEDVDMTVAVDLLERVGLVDRHHAVPRRNIGTDGLGCAGGVAAPKAAEQGGKTAGAHALVGTVDYKTGLTNIYRGGDHAKIEGGHACGYQYHPDEQFAEIADPGPEGLEHALFLNVADGFKYETSHGHNAS